MRTIGRALAATGIAAAALAAGAPMAPSAMAATSHQTERAKPEETVIQQRRFANYAGPLGLPMYARGPLEPWIDRRGRLLREVTR
jgi:hypothetical protein